VGQQPGCNFHDIVIERLQEKFSETVVWWGINGAGALVELATAESGSWSLIVTRPDGWACLVSIGEGSRAIEREPQPEGTAL
jgi:hypothetical protein